MEEAGEGRGVRSLRFVEISRRPVVEEQGQERPDARDACAFDSKAGLETSGLVLDSRVDLWRQLLQRRLAGGHHHRVT